MMTYHFNFNNLFVSEVKLYKWLTQPLTIINSMMLTDPSPKLKLPDCNLNREDTKISKVPSLF